MTSVKERVKQAREAIARKEYAEAETCAKVVLELDEKNYNGLVLLAVACSHLGREKEAEQLYEKAISEDNGNPLAWQGLQLLLEKSEQWDPLANLLLRRLDKETVLRESADPQKCTDFVERIVQIRRRLWSQDKGSNPVEVGRPLITALEHYLPDSELNRHELLERCPSAESVVREMAAITAHMEEFTFDKEVKLRRTRLGAGTAEQIKAGVFKDIATDSRLPALWMSLLDYSNDDAERRQTESKLLAYLLRMLKSLSGSDGSEQQATLRQQILDLAHGMRVVKSEDELAWDIGLNWLDVQFLDQYDNLLIEQYCEALPSTPMSSLWSVYLELLRHKGEPTSASGMCNRLVEAFDRLERPPPIAFRILAQIYTSNRYNLQDLDTAQDLLTSALTSLRELEKASGLQLVKVATGLELELAKSLVQNSLQQRKDLERAKVLVKAILQRRQVDVVEAHFLQGVLAEKQESWGEARFSFEAVIASSSARKSSSHQAEAMEGLAWCQLKLGDVSRALHGLKYQLEHSCADEPPSRLARLAWRIGEAYLLEGNAAESFHFYIRSVKYDQKYAPAYTSLGLYYESHANEGIRAFKCFQKAFELDCTQYVAGERLARHFADLGDWEFTYIVADRVAASLNGAARAKLETAWAFHALGLVYLRREDYSNAVVNFQIALRANPANLDAWIGLGESYGNSGRPVAALKTFERARQVGQGGGQSEEMLSNAWYASFSLGQVQKQLGLNKEAARTLEDIQGLRPNELGLNALLQEVYLAWGKERKVMGFLGQAKSHFVRALHYSGACIASDAQNARGIVTIWKGLASTLGELETLGSMNESEDSVSELMRQIRAILKDEEIDVRLPAFNALTVETAERINNTSLSAFLLVHKVLVHKYIVLLDHQDKNKTGSSWLDLALAANLLSKQSSIMVTRPDIMPLAEIAIAQAIKAEPRNPGFWNGFGVILTSKDLVKARKAFLRAIELAPKVAISWTNLGLVFLLEQNYSSALSAFTNAQTRDPNWVRAWLGQAFHGDLTAKDSSDVLSKYLHCFSFSKDLEAEAAYGLAKWTLKRMRLEESQVITSTLLSSSAWALEQSLKRDPSNLSLLLMQTLIAEQQCSSSFPAQKCIQSLASHVMPSANGDGASVTDLVRLVIETTRARGFLGTHENEQAIQGFERALQMLSYTDQHAELTRTGTLSEGSMNALRVQCLVGLGVAYHFQGETELSLESLQTAIDRASAAGEVPTEQAVDLLTATLTLTKILWSAAGEDEREEAKAQLMSFNGDDESGPKPIEIVMALLSIAIVMNDEAAIEEQRKQLASIIKRQKEVQFEPLQVDSTLSRGVTGLGDFDVSSLKEAKQICVDAGNDKEALLTLAALALQMKDRRSALEAINKYSVLYGDDGRSLRLQIRIQSLPTEVSEDVNGSEPEHRTVLHINGDGDGDGKSKDLDSSDKPTPADRSRGLGNKLIRLEPWLMENWALLAETRV